MNFSLMKMVYEWNAQRIYEGDYDDRCSADIIYVT